MAYFKLDQRDKAAEIVEYLKTINNGVGSPAYCLALIFAEMGDVNTAFEWLNKAYEDRQGELYWLQEEPTFKLLHDDRRWPEMLDNVGFPE